MTSGAWKVKLLIVVAIVVQTSDAVVLYPYGPGAGDTSTPKTDDGSSPSLTATTGFKYYGTIYNTFYVSTSCTFH